MPPIPPSDNSRNLERLTTSCTKRLCTLDASRRAVHDPLVLRRRHWPSQHKSDLDGTSSADSFTFTTSDETDSPMSETDATPDGSAMPSASNTDDSETAAQSNSTSVQMPSTRNSVSESIASTSGTSSSQPSSITFTSSSIPSATLATITVTTSASRSQVIVLPEASSSSATPLRSHHKSLVAIVVPSVIVPLVVLGALAVAAILLLRRRRRRRQSMTAPPGESFLPEEGFVLRVVPPYGSSSTVGTSARTTNPYSPVAVEDESTNSPSQASPWTSSPVSPHPFAYSPLLTEPADVPHFQAQWVPADDGHDRRPSYSNRRTMRLLRALADAEPLRTSSVPETPLPDAK
ncbi:hypothetical protein EXIGLDRAFT_465377 [Exidia glandulosa HHB12029]|uniref:Uncharacterized protein n=1 Tax=Exidia glandulosa HHB12029 TaxID=1314781 RepID=A0A165K2P0_EXIGL|nr:hypothetical protein EXIGLDRAFT_465377 [Exidia glandulosa HHB12029]